MDYFLAGKDQQQTNQPNDQQRYLQRGLLPTPCPHSTNWNCDLDSKYLPCLWLV